MRAATIILLLWTETVVLAQDQKSVLYTIQFAEGNGTSSCLPPSGASPISINISTSVFSTILNVMEEAADTDSRFQFSATFTEVNGRIGYVVNSVSGVSANEICTWIVSVQSGTSSQQVDMDVSMYIPGNNFQITLSYEPRQATPTISTRYTITYPDLVCSTAMPPDPVVLTTPTGSTALDVMEEAVVQLGVDYQFSLTYQGAESGYRIDQLNNVAANSTCLWLVYVTAPNSLEDTRITTSISLFTIPGNGYALSLRYTELDEPTVAATTRAGSKGLHSAVTIITVLLLSTTLVFSLL